MRVLFFIQNVHVFHYYRSIIEALHERGHDVSLFFNKGQRITRAVAKKMEDYEEVLKSAKLEIKGFNYEIVEDQNSKFTPIISFTRAILNYRRQLLVEDQSVYYLERLRKLFPKWSAGFVFLPFFRPIIRTEFCAKACKWFEKIIPVNRTIFERVRSLRPDFVLVSPPNLKGDSLDSEYLKAAHKLGIPSAIPVISWDYLGTKGIITTVPDLLLVWNETQIQDAIKHHAIDESRTKIAGATVFDKWFDLPEHIESREAFSKRFGLDASRPILLYLGSSSNMAADESWMVKKLREVLDRSSDPKLKNTEIIIRPHPFNFHIYSHLLAKGRIELVPRNGSLPNTEDNFSTFVSSVMHSYAVVQGVNTSGIIEAMIVGKPGVTILTEQYKKTQDDTSHFRQLLSSDAIEVSQNFENLDTILSKLASGIDLKKDGREHFIDTFIRPLGRKDTAGMQVVRALENYKNK